MAAIARLKARVAELEQIRTSLIAENEQLRAQLHEAVSRETATDVSRETAAKPAPAKRK